MATAIQLAMVIDEEGMESPLLLSLASEIGPLSGTLIWRLGMSEVGRTHFNGLFDTRGKAMRARQKLLKQFPDEMEFVTRDELLRRLGWFLEDLRTE